MSILFAMFFFPIGMIMGIVGLILAMLQNKEQKSGINTAGLVTSIVGTVLSILTTLTLLTLISFTVAQNIATETDYTNINTTETTSCEDSGGICATDPSCFEITQITGKTYRADPQLQCPENRYCCTQLQQN